MATALLAILLLANLSVPGIAISASQDSTAYKYTTDDGTVLFTDIKVSKQELKSGKVSLQQLANGQTGRRSYQGSYGRPQATASCKNLSAQALAERAVLIEPLIERLSAQYEIDWQLSKAIARIESCFDPRAQSTAGAKGLMQLMPLTAAHYGVTDLYDPEQNIGGGIRYFAEMLERYHQNTSHALAAYNAGPTAVDKYQGIPPYPETRNYVRKVLKKYREYSRLSGNTASARHNDQPGQTQAQIPQTSQ